MTDTYNENSVKLFSTLNYIWEYAGGKCNNLRKKNFIKPYEYLSRYLNAIKGVNLQPANIENSGIIWQCWLQGEENMPELIKACTESVKNFNKNRKIVLITEKNLHEYISVPDYISDKYKKGIIPVAQFSDIIRLMLLEKYGGIWMDSTVLLTGCIPKEAYTLDFFTYKNPMAQCFKYVHTMKDLELMCNYMNSTIMLPSTWFISASKGNIVISYWLKLLLEYWKNENGLIDYFIMDYFFVLLLLNNPICRQIYTELPEYSTVPVNILQAAMPEEYNDELFEMIKTFTPVHKLTRKYFPDNSKTNRFYNKIIQNL